MGRAPTFGISGKSTLFSGPKYRLKTSDGFSFCRVFARVSSIILRAYDSMDKPTRFASACCQALSLGSMSRRTVIVELMGLLVSSCPEVRRKNTKMQANKASPRQPVVSRNTPSTAQADRLTIDGYPRRLITAINTSLFGSLISSKSGEFFMALGMPLPTPTKGSR